MSFLTEEWTIEYYMRKQDGTVTQVTEPFPCKAGYYQRLCELGLDQNSVIKAVQGNYVRLRQGAQEEGRSLPLEKRLDLAGARLLVSQSHPIVLTAPNGTKYTRTQF